MNSQYLKNLSQKAPSPYSKKRTKTQKSFSLDLPLTFHYLIIRTRVINM